MASGESFDPRTWKGDDSARATVPASAVKAVATASPVPTVSYTVTGARFRWWLGPLLSAAVLAGGALAAYETRGAASAVAASKAG